MVRERTDILKVLLSHDNKQLIYLTKEHVKIRDVYNLERVLESIAYSDIRYSCIALSPDGRTLVIGFTEKKSGKEGLLLWDLRESRSLARLLARQEEKPHVQGHIHAAAFAAQGNLIVSVHADTLVHVWDKEKCERVGVLEGHMGEVTCVVADFNLAFTGSSDKTVRIWNVREMRAEGSIEAHTGAVVCLALTHDSKFLVSCGADRLVKVWSLAE